MWNKLLVYFLPIMTLIVSPALPGFVYGQNMCGDTPWGLPLEGDLKVNSSFNNTKKPFHYGVDYKAADGDNVLAVADGEIGKIGYDIRQLPKPNPRTGLMVQGWGRYVVVDHTDGSQTLYAHLLMDSTNDLSIGIPVTKGTIIGKADSTGGVTGPHLHLEYSPAGEIFDNKSKMDPDPCVHKPVECGTSKIGYTTKQMSINQTQTLTVTNPDPGATYTWNVASGGGSISPTTGTSVTYTAPATNPNCLQNSIITLGVEGQVCDSLQIAVNAISGNAVAFVYASGDCPFGGLSEWIPNGCGSPGNSWYCGAEMYRYNCDNIYLGHSCCVDAGGGCAYNYNPPFTGCAEKTSRCVNCQTWNGILVGCGAGRTDTRSDAMKAAGCCPAALLPK